MIILICGGRDFKDWNMFVAAMVEASVHLPKKYCIVSGGARGADAFARRWAMQNNIPYFECPAWWEFGNSAGTIRNGWMIEFMKVSLVIAFPGGSGTANMKNQARRKKIPVWEPANAK